MEENLDFENTKNRIDFLVRNIKYYDYMLHIKGKTLISDELYDSMRRELETLESLFPNLIKPDSPSLYIGHISNSCNKIITRTYPMMSLKHTYNYQEIENFVTNILKIDNQIVLEPKIDGVAVSLEYYDGILDSVSLRGDGIKGEDVTHLAPYIKNLSMKVDGFNGTIRGEVITPKNIVKENNRNYVSGCLRRKNSGDFNLHLYSYYVKNENIGTQKEALVFLEQNDFKIPEFYIIESLDNLENIINDFKKKEYDFFTDGVVLKINNLQKGIDLGVTNRYPKNAIAYKFAEKFQNTVIKKIQWNINKKGILTPVCVLEPIKIEGNLISKVHGFNKKYLEINNIGENTEVSIARVGEVIPQIATIIKSTQFNSLEVCPFCSEKLEITEINYICQNENCEAKKIQNITYFFEKLKIDGLTEKVIKRFLDNNYQEIENIIENIETKNWIISKNDWNIYYKWIEKKQHITLKNLLIALAIPNVSDGFINGLEIENLEDLKQYIFLQQSTLNKIKTQNFIDFINNNEQKIQTLWNLVKN